MKLARGATIAVDKVYIQQTNIMKFSFYEGRNVILFASFLTSLLFILVSPYFGSLVFLFDLNNHGVLFVSTLTEDRALIESDYYYNKSRDSSVDTTTGYLLEGRGSIPDRSKIFSLIYNFQTGTGTHLACYPVGPDGSFPGGKAARA
jgi:hypothetical protein